MGYYTDYTLDFSRENGSMTIEECDAVWKKLSEISGYEFDDVDINHGWMNAKWYNSHEDMATLSLWFPDVIFDLHGCGEESEDLWDITYVNGYCHSRCAEIPPFDAKKLQQCHLFREEFLPPKIVDIPASILEGVI